MGIKLMLRKIGVKLLISYLVLLIAAFSISSATYNFLSNRYLINETRKQLRSEGQAVAQLFTNMPLNDKAIKDKLVGKTIIRAAERFIESDMIIIGKDGSIVYKSIASIDRKTVLKFIKSGSIKYEGYIGERIAILDKTGNIKGYVVLIAKLKSVYGLNRLMRGTELISILAAGLVALFISLFFEKSLVKPITILMNKINKYSKTKILGSETIKTGDEIQQLDECFSEMAKSISQYDEAQKKFLQNTSHELKTPLMSIQGYAEAIKDGLINGREMQEGLDIIIQQSQRLKRIVEELSFLTRLENPEEVLEKQEVNLKELVYSVSHSIKPLANEKNIKIESNIKEDVIIQCDRDKIERALINVFSNGIRYAKSELSVGLLKGNGFVKLIIKDDGCGFLNHEENKIFDRFYKGKDGNTGLGLAIVKAIVESHKGAVKAYNNMPCGAVFEILLPE